MGNARYFLGGAEVSREEYFAHYESIPRRGSAPRPDVLVVGAGFAGSVCAERLAAAGKRVLVIDKRPHIGGNAYDYYDEAGILVHKYGAHIFHTNSRAVVDYLSRFTAWRPYEHRVLSSVNGQLLPVPINRTTLAAFDGDLAAARRALYEPYTRKQWGDYADELAPTVLARVQPRDSDDDRYFTDAFQAMPMDGYTRLLERMLSHPNIDVSLNHRGPTVDTDTSGMQVIYTGPIDEFFDYRFGRLPYRSADFVFRTVTGRAQFQPVGVVNYPSPDVDCTRVIEFKHLTGQEHPDTTIAMEYPTAAGEPYWPVPTAASRALYQQYAELAARTPGVHFLGRLGTYRYYDIHQIVAQALTVSRKLLAQEDTAVCQI